MKITKRLVALLVALSLFLAMFAPSIVSAAEFKEGEHYILPAGKDISEDLFVAGNRVEILGDVDENLFVAANIIDIQGTIYGTAYLFGNRVEILGEVDGDLFVAANIIDIQGTIHGTAYLTGNYVALHGKVDRDVLAAVNQLWIEGSVGQDLRVVAGGTSQAVGPMAAVGESFGTVPRVFSEGLLIDASAQIGGNVHAFVDGPTLIAGTVDGGVDLFGGDIVTLSGTVEQDVELRSGVEIVFPPELHVKGTLLYQAPEPAESEPPEAVYQGPVTAPAEEGAGLGRWLWRTLLALGGFAFVLAFTRWAGRDRWEHIALTARIQLGGSILWGIVSLLAVPFLLLLLPGITWALFGTPLALGVFVFLGVSWFLCWSLSPVVSGRNLATYLQPTMPGEQSTYVGELLGVLLVVLLVRLGSIPLADLPALPVLLRLLAGLVLTVSYVLAVGGWIQSWVQPKDTTPSTEILSPA